MFHPVGDGQNTKVLDINPNFHPYNKQTRFATKKSVFLPNVISCLIRERELFHYLASYAWSSNTAEFSPAFRCSLMIQLQQSGRIW